MKRQITCIECPKGCVLSIDADKGKVISITGNECPKGEKYAVSEIENPVRILTSTVLGVGLSEKMVPVRTDKPIPKPDIFRVMEEVRKARIDRPVKMGEVVIEDVLGMGVNLIATMEVGKGVRPPL